MAAVPTSTRRSTRARDTRDAILGAAVVIMQERGFTGTRVADIAQRAKVSSGLVLYHFGTREQLLASALRHSEEVFIVHVHRAIATVIDPKARLLRLIELSYEESDQFALPSSWLLWLDMWQQALRNDVIRADAEELDKQWRDLLADTVRAGQELGQFSNADADDFARMFSAMQDGFAVAIALGDSLLTKDKALQLCLRLCDYELRPAGGGLLFG